MWNFADVADGSYTLYAQWEVVEDTNAVNPVKPETPTTDGNSTLVETGVNTVETITVGLALIGLAILSLRRYSTK